MQPSRSFSILAVLLLTAAGQLAAANVPASGAPGRPQDPRPPFPYTEEEVRYSNGPANLAGTLTLPPGAGPFPAVLLLSGAGPQNRNGEVFGHRRYLVLADHLTRAGIAVLRVDDRGVGGSTGGSVMDSTLADFAEDALAGVAFLRSHARIDPSRVGLSGPSEGGMVALRAAARSQDVAFLVLLAAPVLPESELMLRQHEQAARAAGVEEKTIRERLTLLEQALDLLRSPKGEEELRPALRDINVRLMTLSSASEIPPGASREALVERMVGLLLSRRIRSELGQDPRADARRVRVPVLALYGDKDVQVEAALHAPELEKALKESGAKDVTIVRLPGLNHFLQTSETGRPDEYARIEETIAPAALDRIAGWILERGGSGTL